VLDGLEYAHNLPYKIELPDGTYKSVRGIVHRDLKPANFFLHYQDGKTLVKVGDYGLAKSFDFAGLSGFSRSGDRAMGTLAFMPRQQVKNFKYVQPDVDVWATAASLYYMLTGELVRDFERARDPDLAVLTEPVIPILERRGDLPRGLAAAIDRALQEEPRIYYQSVGDFRRAILGG
jgi:eukaryotic-like serine/threonine-protein kinase